MDTIAGFCLMLSLLTSDPDIANSIEKRNVNSFFQSYSDARYFMHENSVIIDDFTITEMTDTILGKLTVSVDPDVNNNGYILTFDTPDQRFFDSVRYLGDSIHRSGVGLTMGDEAYSSKSDFTSFDHEDEIFLISVTERGDYCSIVMHIIDRKSLFGE